MDAGGKAMSASVALMSSSVGVAHGRRAVIGSGGALSYGALLARSGAIAKLLHRHGAADERLGLDRAALDAILADRVGFVGTAPHQVASFVGQVEAIVAEHPDAARYRPEPIL
jgi:adenylosuccinate lyase